MKQLIALILILLFLDTGKILRTSTFSLNITSEIQIQFSGAAIWCFSGTPTYMVEQKCPVGNHKCIKLETECKLNMPQDQTMKRKINSILMYPPSLT